MHFGFPFTNFAFTSTVVISPSSSDKYIPVMSPVALSNTAFFTFENPDVFESATGDITGMYLSDEEGEMTTVDVNAKFVNGKPKCIEARYIMRSSQEWERFMRFMTRYAEDNGLGFNKTS
jgi:photosystem II protein